MYRYRRHMNFNPIIVRLKLERLQRYADFGNLFQSYYSSIKTYFQNMGYLVTKAFQSYYSSIKTMIYHIPAIA